MTTPPMINGIAVYIYFPTPYEYVSNPYLLYVDARFENHLRGNPDLEALRAGRFGLFGASRCQPNSEELWDHCQQWIDASVELKRRYKRLTQGKV